MGHGRGVVNETACSRAEAAAALAVAPKARAWHGARVVGPWTGDPAVMPGLSRILAGTCCASLPGTLLLAWLASPLSPVASPAQALELNGSTLFVRAPWKAELISYDTNAGSAPVSYYLTLSLDPGAGASLGRVSMQQTRGADWSFPFSPQLTRAFLGRPRRQGQSVAVQAEFDARERRISVSFPEPVPPGETVTVVLRPWRNPQFPDTYLFQVVAWPAGPNPVASPVGTATLRIYERLLY